MYLHCPSQSKSYPEKSHQIITIGETSQVAKKYHHVQSEGPQIGNQNQAKELDLNFIIKRTIMDNSDHLKGEALEVSIEQFEEYKSEISEEEDNFSSQIFKSCEIQLSNTKNEQPSNNLINSPALSRNNNEGQHLRSKCGVQNDLQVNKAFIPAMHCLQEHEQNLNGFYDNVKNDEIQIGCSSIWEHTSQNKSSPPQQSQASTFAVHNCINLASFKIQRFVYQAQNQEVQQTHFEDLNEDEIPDEREYI
ncbi:hypothetical protein FGO68_gene3041 [Halteria grandinella]|uniref:Uncharacterized protein n=1 Tax=Halteria grandinella TaxID=5974 RepID=A0A8J8SZP4_HALGN|nr:hypothetical protein FGO68_gene3041 [Halteria grandinella]